MSFSLHPTLEADSIAVASMQLCELRLINNQEFVWFILVPEIQGATELHLLASAEREQFYAESHWLCSLLDQVFKPDKLNVAALGNMVPQLHVHHVARFQTDAAWPRPIWGEASTPYTDQNLQVLISAVKKGASNLKPPAQFQWSV